MIYTYRCGLLIICLNKIVQNSKFCIDMEFKVTFLRLLELEGKGRREGGERRREEDIEVWERGSSGERGGEGKGERGERGREGGEGKE